MGCVSLCAFLHEDSQGDWTPGDWGLPGPPLLTLWGQSRLHCGFSSVLPQEFILSCLARDPARRPSAHNLLFHRVLFEVHSLKLLAAHCFIQHQCEGQAGPGGLRAWGWDVEGDPPESMAQGPPP